MDTTAADRTSALRRIVAALALLAGDVLSPSSTGDPSGAGPSGLEAPDLELAAEWPSPVASAPGSRLTELAGWMALAARVEAIILDLTAEIDAGGDAETEAGCSLRSWLALTGRVSSRGAGLLIDRAKRLRRCERIGDALAAGSISPEQADVATAAVAALPADLAAGDHDRAEQTMLDHTSRFGPRELRQLGNHLVHVVAPEVAEAHDAALLERDHRHALRRRSLSWASDGCGSIQFRAQLPEVDAQSLIGVIDAAAHQAHRNADVLRAADTEDDVAPTFAQRRADALLDLAAHAHSCSSAPAHGGDRPRLLVTITEESLRERLHPTMTRDRPPPTGILATSGARVPVEVLRAMACEAELLPVVLGGAGQVLDVGRAQRLVTAAIRTALTLRDGGCVMPGCDQPPQHCEAHHVLPWQAGGETALHNLALLCRQHHRLLEPHPNAPPGSRWELRINDEGLPETIPPARIDPWRRALLHRHQRPARAG